MIHELTVNLRLAPNARWRFTPEQREQARELRNLYQRDLSLPSMAGEFFVSAAKGLISEEHWEEMESIAHEVSVPIGDVVLCNCYYDVLKFMMGPAFGCTAFAIDAPGGVLHARNLDWWTEDFTLSRYTTITHFLGGRAGDFTTIGWPGFVGAFSGIAPGRFAVTLNAVVSTEPARMAPPVAFLLRSVLEEARSFDEARGLLSNSQIPCDCLLLLTGASPGELVVIERTPTRHAIRGPEGGYICVTNGYQALIAGHENGPSELFGTWCERFLRVESLIRNLRPEGPTDCFRYLSDAEVRMQMTVQQMVFRDATGEYWAQLPQSTEAA